ncbi:beta-1,3-galactosyltransferase 2 [Argonauta hians]
MRRLLTRPIIKCPLLLIFLGTVFLFFIHSTITSDRFDIHALHLNREKILQLHYDFPNPVEKECLLKKALKNGLQKLLAFRAASSNETDSVSERDIPSEETDSVSVQSSNSAPRNNSELFSNNSTHTMIISKNLSVAGGNRTNILLDTYHSKENHSVEDNTTEAEILEKSVKKMTSSLVGPTSQIKQIKAVTQKMLLLNQRTIPSQKMYNPHPFYFRLDANELCSRRDPPFLLIVVPSIHDHMDIRNAIRQTWASVAKDHVWPGRKVRETVKLAFLLGLHQFPEREGILIAESKKYGDIIQENFIDSYYNLSIKILMALKWSSNYCPGVNYILKADEDTFVNIPMLVDILRLPETPRHSIIGRIMPESKVYRFGRWKVDKNTYPQKIYPPYAAGNTYIIPGSIARKLFQASKYHVYLQVEDAFITGVLAQVIGASHFSIPGFTFQTDSPPEACDFIMDLKISGTKASMGLIRHIWSQIKKQINCEEE